MREGTSLTKTDNIQIFLGLDVSKIWNRHLPNDEAKLTRDYQELSTQGTVLVVVDQLATIGALAVAVAQPLDITVAYLPGLAMRRIADMYPGTAKTDEKDAFFIDNAALTMQYTLHGLQVSDKEEAARGMHTQIHPPLERLLGARLDYDVTLEVLVVWPTPARCSMQAKPKSMRN